MNKGSAIILVGLLLTVTFPNEANAQIQFGVSWKTERTIKSDDADRLRNFRSNLASHVRWLGSDGAGGTQFVLMSKTATPLDYKFLSLRNAISDHTLSKSVFTNVSFSSAYLTNNFLYHASLTKVDFNEATLHKLDLSFADVSEVQFKTAVLTNVQFGASRLTNVDFNNAHMTNVGFNQAALENVHFTSSTLNFVHFPEAFFADGAFKNAYLTNSGFRKAQMSNVYFLDSVLASVDFGYAHLTNGGFLRSELTRIDFRNADLDDVAFAESKLLNVHFGSAHLANVYFTRANLKNIDFTGSGLSNLYCVEAGITNVDFSFAGLTDVNFSSAGLSNVFWNNAKLKNVSFQNASMLKMDFEDAVLENVVLRPKRLIVDSWKRATLANVYFRPEDTNLFGSRDLSGTIFSNVSLAGFEFNSSSLRNAGLYNSDVDHANFTDALWELKPHSLPYLPSMATAVGLETIYFDVRPSAMVELRNALRDAGMNEQARDVHYALKVQERKNLQKHWTKNVFAIGYYWTFEILSAYGRHGTRPLLWMLAIGLFGSVLYARCIFASHSFGSKDDPATILDPDGKPIPEMEPATIWLTKSDDSIIRNHPFEEKRPVLENTGRREMWRFKSPRCRRGWFHAFYFSMISTFGIGFRELNIGTWLSRLDTRQVALRSTGWVQVVAGLQRIIGVVLFAVFIISYFHLPIE